MQESPKTQLTQIGKPITITVMAEELFGLEYPPSSNEGVNNFTKIENGPGGYGESKEGFTTNVHKYDVVLWKIGFEDNNQRKDYQLELVCISQKPENGVNFFDFHPLLPTSNTILATVSHGSPQDVYHYNIIFTISDYYGDSRTYVIDPQLKMQ